MKDTRPAWLGAVGSFLVFVGVFSHYYAVPELISRMIVSNVVLKDGSEALERWSHTPQPLHYDVYFFHVENPMEVMKGARPVLQEKGPYVYDLFRERADIKFHKDKDDDTVSYFDKATYRFNQEKSGCRTDNDVVTVLHAPIVGTANKLQKKMPDALGIFNDAMEIMFDKPSSPFATARVRELLFDGMFINCSVKEDSFPAGPLCEGMRDRAPHTYRRDGKNFYFSLFNHLNATSKRRMRISRGLRDPAMLGRIKRVGNSSAVSTWRPGTHCNLVNGTDSTLFRPFLHGVDRLPVYQAGSCRSLYLVFTHETEVNGVPALHFITDPNMFSSGREYLPNRCFCPLPPEPEEDPDAEQGDDQGNGGGGEVTDGQATTAAPAERRRRRRSASKADDEKDAQECLPEGALDMGTCFGSPVVMTYPHFYLGAPSLQAYPIGMRPDKEKHHTIVELEPETGIPMRGAKRVQLNMYLKKIEDITVLEGVSEGLFPILWLEEGITLEGVSMQKIQTAHRGLQVVRASPLALGGLGALVLLAGALLQAHGMGLFIRAMMMMGVGLPKMPGPGPHRVNSDMAGLKRVPPGLYR